MSGLPDSTRNTPIGSALGSNRGDLLRNPLVTFGLNKALISTGLEEPWPKGLIRYRLTKGVATTLVRIPTDLTLNIGRQFVADFRTAGTVVGVSLESAEEAGRWVFQFSRGSIATERLIVDKAGGFRVIATNYDRALNLGKLVRSVPLEGPLFLLDAGVNGYFQYQAESNLPQDLRLKRAVAGGAGNAAISAGVAIGGAALIAQFGLCPETFGATCISAGLTILAADLGLNYAFDKWGGKEWYLETVFGWGDEELGEQ